MADQDLRIRVAAETGAAQDALGKLADEMAGLATTTKGAGGDLKDLHKQTAQTTQAVKAATEATRAAAKAQAEAVAVTQAFGKDSREAAEAQARLKVAQEAATKATREAERAIEANAKAIGEAGKAAGGASPQLRRMHETLEKTGKEARNAASDLRTLEVRMHDVGAGAGRMSMAWASFKGNLAADAVGVLAGGLKDLGIHALSTAANYEQLQTSLTTTLRSTEAATAQFAELQKFAAATPFSLQEVTSAFVKLKNQGLDASARSMTALGDITSAMGKSLDDITEAALDAAQGEGERLKEFGIRMSKHGDNVSLTFRGVTQTIQADSREIQKYLVELGEANFAGGMEAQSKTLSGLWSTMKDGFDQFVVSIVNSGIASALKSMMGSLSGMGETASMLVDVLGTGLGGTFQVLAGAVSVATTAIEGFAWVANNVVIGPIKYLKEGVEELTDKTLVAHQERIEEINAAGIAYADQMRQQEKEMRVRTAAEAEYVNGVGGDMSRLTEEQLFTMREVGQVAVERLRQQEAERGWLLELTDAAGAYAREVAVLGIEHLAAANAAERQAQAEDELWIKLQKRFDKEAEKAEEEAFFEAAQTGPRLADGSFNSKPKEKPKRGKKERDHSRELSLKFGAEAFEKRERTERERAFAEASRAYEQESEMRERRIAGMGAEIDLLSKRADRERESVDLILFSVDVESQAAMARNALIDERLRKEAQLAQWEIKNAKTREQREKAQTRAFEVESRKRAVAVQREVDAEEREHRKRQQVVEHVAGAVQTLGAGMVDAFEKMAAGEKGAIASMLSELLKGVAKKHAILALGEAALAIGAAASYRYAAAAQHGTAAALHTGVAIAAGVGAYAAGQVADARAGGEASGGGGGGGGRGGSGFGRPSPSGSDRDDGLEAQDVPVSHEQHRRGDPAMSRKGAASGSQVVISGTINMYGAGGREEFIDGIRKGLDRQDRAGKRYRN